MCLQHKRGLRFIRRSACARTLPAFFSRIAQFGPFDWRTLPHRPILGSTLDCPVFIFAPGAGAPSSHHWMRRWRDLLKTIGIVWTFDYPYMVEGRKRPDPLPKLIAAHCEAFTLARQAHQGPAVLIGKSMGSRVGCHVALEKRVAAVVCLGYPLCAGGDPAKLRDKVLRELSTPILFVQGTRDPLCPLDLLEKVRGEMRAANQL